MSSVSLPWTMAATGPTAQFLCTQYLPDGVEPLNESRVRLRRRLGGQRDGEQRGKQGSFDHRGTDQMYPNKGGNPITTIAAHTA